MKRITIEQAEESPLRLGMSKKLNASSGPKVVICNYYRKFHHEIEVYNRIYRFINKYVGKKYDICYSDFVHWLKSERIFNHGYNKDNMIELFKDNFDFYESEIWYRSLRRFTLVNGIIVPIPEEPRKKYPVYKEYIYTLKPRCYDKTSEYIFILTFGGKELARLKSGVGLEDYLKYTNDAYLRDKMGNNHNWYNYTHSFAKTPVGDPIEGKEKIKYYAEKAAKERKYYRDSERKKRELIDSIVIKSYATVRERKKQLKRIDQANAKREEELNIITRDRLGFDEESFKTPQKFK